MERDIINIMLAQYKSKKYRNGVILFFNDENKVIGIKTKFALVVGFSVDTDPNRIFLMSYLFNGQVGKSIMTKDRTFVVPTTDTLRLYDKPKEYDEITEAALPALYEVVNYGFLDSEMYKGCNMSQAKIQVFVRASSKCLYETSFVTGEKVIAGLPTIIDEYDNYYPGMIEKSYIMVPLGKMIDGKIML